MSFMAYRWYVVNAQEMCVLDIIELVDGWFSDAESVQAYLKEKYNFKECLFRVQPIVESETPVYLLPKGEYHE